MASFTDRHGRAWQLSITYGDLKTLRESGFDVNAIFGPDGIDALAALTPGDVLLAAAHLVETNGGAPSKEVMFDDALDGPAYRRLTAALLETATDFFPFSRLAAFIAAKTGAAVLDLMAQSARGSSDSAANSPASAG